MDLETPYLLTYLLRGVIANDVETLSDVARY